MKPTNTSTQDPLINFAEVAFLGGVEGQESRGQHQLVHGESLPSECDDRDALAAAGVVFGEPYPDDPLFCPVTLPAGWKKQATDHAMHSRLLDDKGRVRARIFYKAASYDRRADMQPVCRYSVDAYHPGSSRESSQCVAKDGETVLQSFGEAAGYEERQGLRGKAEDWLSYHFPDWRNAAAYWD